MRSGSNDNKKILTPESCAHKNKSIVVIQAIVECETTIIKCCDCGKVITEPEINC